MLGAKFFHEVQGQQRQHSSKTYDVNHVQDADDEIFFTDDAGSSHTSGDHDLPDSVVERFLNEGDEDALICQQFEDALIDVVQSDGEMGTFMSTYF